MVIASPALLRLVAAIMAALVVTSEGSEGSRRQPNVILFLGDDIGWADVQRHDTQMRTPHLEWMATNGMELKYSYVLPTCAPTRSALLTGRYPYTFGMQVNEIKSNKLAWLDETLTLLPATLRDLGYRTHMIGKWHLGFCNETLTPTGRGFDTFYGFYTGAQGYFNHSGNGFNSYDFRDNDRLVTEARGHYSTELHTTRAQSIIRNATDSNAPFFLYFAFQNAHGPFEAKQRYVDRYCSHVNDTGRRIHCAMVAAMDESMANITETLQEENLLENTILIFLSDNGGPVGGSAFNWPLRGQKSTLWEGGTRSYTVVYSPLLQGAAGQKYDGLFHAVDWYPTLIQAAGGTPPSGLDGMGMWSELRNNQPTNDSRQGFIYNMDDRNDRYALRWKQWKLTKGSPGRKYNGWYPYPSLGQPEERGPRKGDLTGWQLFDIEADPEERNNVFRDPNNRSVKRSMKREFRKQRKRLVPVLDGPSSPEGRELMEQNHAFTTGWCNPQTQGRNGIASGENRAEGGAEGGRRRGGNRNGRNRARGRNRGGNRARGGNRGRNRGRNNGRNQSRARRGRRGGSSGTRRGGRRGGA